MTFSLLLKELREERGVSQKEVANYLGITRQAFALYEQKKRKPDYAIMGKIADYFDVSVDYLLGRTKFRDQMLDTIAKNLKLMRGDLSFKELSDDICNKYGVFVFPDILEMYEKGEKKPYEGLIKLFSRYANVPEVFFYLSNTKDVYDKEKVEIIKYKDNSEFEHVNQNIFKQFKFMGSELIKWVMDENNIEYVIFSKQMQEAGVSVHVLKPIVDLYKENCIKVACDC